MASPLRALVVGNSDGIGLAFTRRLLQRGWLVSGISRSPGSLNDAGYHHLRLDVSSPEYGERLCSLLEENGPFDLCVYCAGIAAHVTPAQLDADLHVFEVNLMAAIRTAEAVIPSMLSRDRGHLVVLSSQADELVLDEAASYSASKAAMSRYFEGLGLALRKTGVAVTNVRFGFVDTKMARAGFRPFMYTTAQAADVLEKILERRPVRVTRPLMMVPLVWLTKEILGWRVRLS